MRLKPCEIPGCPNLVEHGYCEVHANKAPKADNRKNFKKLDCKKDARTIKFYSGAAWNRTRNAYRKVQPLCEECLRNGKITPSQLVHHKKKLTEILREGLNPYNFQYLEALCNNCHLKELRSYKKPDKFVK